MELLCLMVCLAVVIYVVIVHMYGLKVVQCFLAVSTLCALIVGIWQYYKMPSWDKCIKIHAPYGI